MTGETGTLLRDISSATAAAQNGERFNTADMMIGCALLKPSLYKRRPDTPHANRTMSFQ
jgi:hypothetical protein